MKNLKQFQIKQCEMANLKAGSGGPGVDSLDEFWALISLLDATGHSDQADILVDQLYDGYYPFN